MVELFKFALLPICAYFLGAVPSGLVLSKKFAGIDVRSEGSGNIGATNVRRLAGNGLGIATLAADLSKGALPVALAVFLSPQDEIRRQLYPLATFLAAFLGHLFPIYLRFKGGGKGVATAAGGIYALSATTGLLTTAVFVAIVGLTRRVSAGSLGAAALMPLIYWYTTKSGMTAMGMVVVTAIIWLRHHDNIKRLTTGSEPRL